MMTMLNDEQVASSHCLMLTISIGDLSKNPGSYAIYKLIGGDKDRCVTRQSRISFLIWRKAG